MKYTILSLATASLAPVLAAQVPTDRDRIVSEADTYYNHFWYCDSENILNDTGAGVKSPYTSPGPQRGVSYNINGYDTIDSFQAGIDGGMAAGDVLGPWPDPRCVGLDCSGYVSRAWESERAYTWTLGEISRLINTPQLRMGDILNDEGYHTRMFLRWTQAGKALVYESTTGVSPGRVVERVVSYAGPSSGYVPRRYNRLRDDPEPTILSTFETASLTATLPWDGEGANGFRLQRSTDGVNWTTVKTEPSTAFQSVVTLTANTDNFYRVAGIRSDGTATAYSDAVAVRLSSSATASKVLIVDGLDSWRRRDNVDRPGHSFVIPIAQTLGRLGLEYETVPNEMVVINQVDLSKYYAVIWLAGEDSVKEEALSESEQYQLRNYLKVGGRLLLSGANIAWDLGHRTPTAGVTAADQTRFWDDTDGAFLRDYLHIGYAGEARTTEHRTLGVSGTPLAGLTVDFDDGTHGTYDVRSADAFTPVNGGAALLKYGSSGLNAGVAYSGTFGGGTAPGAVLTLGFGLETVHSAAQRDAFIRALASF